MIADSNSIICSGIATGGWCDCDLWHLFMKDQSSNIFQCIRDIPQDLNCYSDPSKQFWLPFPSMNVIPECFCIESCSGIPGFYYMGREVPPLCSVSNLLLFSDERVCYVYLQLSLLHYYFTSASANYRSRQNGYMWRANNSEVTVRSTLTPSHRWDVSLVGPTQRKISSIYCFR